MQQVTDTMQHTIAHPVEYTGISLHTGLDVHITCLPAPENTGIVFQRNDLPHRPQLVANAHNILSTQRCTSIGCAEEKWYIHTIEHLMAAISMCNIDNLLIEINAEEPPVTDGSASVFVRLLEAAGLKEQTAARHVQVIKEPIFVKENDATLIALPYEGFRISYTLSYDHPFIGTQYIDLEITAETFQQEIASARTFGFTKEVAALHARGLALGGSLDNAVLIDDNGPVNELRYPNEFVRHKVLDLIGDLAVNGRVCGHFIGIKSGHSLNAQLSKKISTNQEAVTCARY